jgi:hypothetical protein
MPVERSNDPRDCLVREKYFTLRPQPLECWLWQQGLPQAAERVFWLHWEEGMRNRDWCSQLPLRQVARLCCIDTSTVTRAYQLLRGLGLIRREDPGRDPANPFQQATAITEVRIPRSLLAELAQYPSRRAPAHSTSRTDAASPVTGPISDSVPEAPRQDAMARKLTRAEIQATMGKLSPSEQQQFFAASRGGLRTLVFDAKTRLSPQERGFLLKQLEQMAHARSRICVRSKYVHTSGEPAQVATGSRLSVLDLARARRLISAAVPNSAQAAEALRQVVWAVEEGALRQFATLKALNIALKKIREGLWTRPNRMPPNWARLHAVPEACVAA